MKAQKKTHFSAQRCPGLVCLGRWFPILSLHTYTVLIGCLLGAVYISGGSICCDFGCNHTWPPAPDNCRPSPPRSRRIPGPPPVPHPHYPTTPGSPGGQPPAGQAGEGPQTAWPGEVGRGGPAGSGRPWAEGGPEGEAGPQAVWRRVPAAAALTRGFGPGAKPPANALDPAAAKPAARRAPPHIRLSLAADGAPESPVPWAPPFCLGSRAADSVAHQVTSAVVDV